MKFQKIKFAVVGGDLRQIKLSNFLAREGYEVRVFGFNGIDFEKNVIISTTLPDVVSNADIVIGPIPCSQENVTLYTKYYEKSILLEDVFKHISKDKVFMAGRITPEIQRIANRYDFKVVDLLAREELAVLNAIPTAEGAIQYAMENSEITLHGSHCLVLGFGRCGKVLAHKLKGLDAHLTVEARNPQDLAYIKSYGYQSLHLHDLKDKIGSYDFIFNTIPSLILDREMLKTVKKDCLIIDLASKPGGVDYNAASELGIKAILALSLPGKVAPESAALIIRDTIFNVYSEMGVIL
ncbi:dipicolinate synthase subunit DpsA [Defluviitalea saccharophila]|uniref:Dipicolinate synthase subunit DpsA n=1 Tax=Defluviitalea saccharophila TaxID=879970 RepID=A0ABZ2Y5S4_9FIRM